MATTNIHDEYNLEKFKGFIKRSLSNKKLNADVLIEEDYIRVIIYIGIRVKENTDELEYEANRLYKQNVKHVNDTIIPFLDSALGIYKYGN